MTIKTTSRSHVSGRFEQKGSTDTSAGVRIREAGQKTEDTRVYINTARAGGDKHEWSATNRRLNGELLFRPSSGSVIDPDRTE